MRLMGDYRGEVPVLDDGRLAGVIWPEDVIKRYNSEVFKRDMAGNMAATVSRPGEVSRLTAAPGAAVAEIPVPSRFVGRTIRELDIRRNFQVSVLMIRHREAGGAEQLDTAPEPDYAFQEGDVLLVLGPSEKLPDLRRGVPRTSADDEPNR